MSLKKKCIEDILDSIQDDDDVNGAVSNLIELMGAPKAGFLKRHTKGLATKVRKGMSREDRALFKGVGTLSGGGENTSGTFKRIIGGVSKWKKKKP